VERVRRLLADPHGPPGWARVALLARLAAGAVFLGFSIGKFTRHGAEADALDRYGLPFPDAFTYGVGFVELIGGAMLVVGLGTRLAALALACDMGGAIATAGRIEGGPVHLGLAPLLLVMMLLVLWIGPGDRSLDRRFLVR
jgi:putative oxidoreductase